MIGPRPGGLPRRPVETAATEKLRLCGKNGEERKGTKPGGGAGQGTRRKKGRRAAAAAGGNSRGLAIGRAAAAKRIEDNRVWPRVYSTHTRESKITTFFGMPSFNLSA
jgi:hypothetical protein